MAQPVTELTLPSLRIQDPAFAADPMRHIRAARLEHSWLAKTDIGYYLVHEYRAIKELSYMDDKFRPAMDGITEIMGAKSGPWFELFIGTTLAKQPPEHTRLRNSVAAAFTPRNVNRHRELMRKVISTLLDEWAPRCAFDFADFAANFPVQVLFGLIGAPAEALPRIRNWLEITGMSANLVQSMLPALNDAVVNLRSFVDDVIAERRRNGRGSEGDLLNTLIAANDTGELTYEEMRDQLVTLFGAGYDTSKNMLTMIMQLMLQHPEHWIRCADELSFCAKVVAEAFRYNSVASLYRTATQDVVYRDVLFEKGINLFMTNSLAGRDPAAFADADTFQPDRRDADQHLGFGRGMHMCLGQHLARAQLQEGVHLIAQRLRNPRLAGEITWRPFPGVWGIRTLPIAFEPGARQTEVGMTRTSAVSLTQLLARP